MIKTTFVQTFILLHRGNKKFKKLRFIKLLPQKSYTFSGGAKGFFAEASKKIKKRKPYLSVLEKVSMEGEGV